MEEIPPSPGASGGATAETIDKLPVSSATQHQQLIAYKYSYSFELPIRKIIPLYEKHRKACEAAGQAKCQIVTASSSNVADGTVSASLTLRAEPAWLTSFRNQLTHDAKGADGRIARSEMSGEDLSREIIDTEAYIRAQATLRDRLQGLLAVRTGKLSDLLELERELARVQGELDSARSRLENMRTRISMSTATLDYGTDPIGLDRIGNDDKSFADVLFERVTDSVLLLLELLAVALPWAVPLGAILWWVLRRRAAKKADKQN